MNVGVLARPTVTEWQRQSLENVASLDGVEITTVVIDATQRTQRTVISAGEDVVNQGSSISLRDFRLFLDVLREDGLKALLYADQKLGWLAFGETSQPTYLETTNLERVACVAGADFIACQPVSLDGPWQTIPQDVTERVGQECDVVFRFGFGLLKGDILDAPEHGVLSVHGSDIREYRGMGPRITFLRDDREAKVTLQQLNDQIDGGEILAVLSAELPPKPTLDDIYSAIYRLQADIFATGVEKLLRGEGTCRPSELGEYYPHTRMHRDPRFVARLILKNNVRRLRKVG